MPTSFRGTKRCEGEEEEEEVEEELENGFNLTTSTSTLPLLGPDVGNLDGGEFGRFHSTTIWIIEVRMYMYIYM